MPINSQKFQPVTIGEITVELCMPDLQEVREKVQNAHDAPVPFWAKLWPSAIALSRFIVANPGLVADKKILELAAGLGLPGLVAAALDATVVLSDYAPEAVVLMRASVEANHFERVTCRQLDWYQLPEGLDCEVLLLSDINYDPADFEVLYQVFLQFLQRGTTIILTTPQRLMAKPFIERMLPYCTRQEEQEVSLNGEQTYISILVLQQ